MTRFNYCKVRLDHDLLMLASQPLALRLLCIGVCCALVFVMSYFLVLRGALLQLNVAQVEQTRLRAAFLQKHQDVANLKAALQQFNQQPVYLQKMLHQLTDQAQLTTVLTEILPIAQRHGLRLQMIKPMPHALQGMLIKYPIQITANGQFHAFARFISDVLAMQYVVTLGHFTLTRAKTPDQMASPEKLDIVFTLDTYQLGSTGELS